MKTQTLRLILAVITLAVAFATPIQASVSIDKKMQHFRTVAETADAATKNVKEVSAPMNGVQKLFHNILESLRNGNAEQSSPKNVSKLVRVKVRRATRVTHSVNSVKSKSVSRQKKALVPTPKQTPVPAATPAPVAKRAAAIVIKQKPAHHHTNLVHRIRVRHPKTVVKQIAPARKADKAEPAPAKLTPFEKLQKTPAAAPIDEKGEMPKQNENDGGESIIPNKGVEARPGPDLQHMSSSELNQWVELTENSNKLNDVRWRSSVEGQRSLKEAHDLQAKYKKGPLELKVEKAAEKTKPNVEPTPLPGVSAAKKVEIKNLPTLTPPITSTANTPGSSPPPNKPRRLREKEVRNMTTSERHIITAVDPFPENKALVDQVNDEEWAIKEAAKKVRILQEKLLPFPNSQEEIYDWLRSSIPNMHERAFYNLQRTMNEVKKTEEPEKGGLNPLAQLALPDDFKEKAMHFEYLLSEQTNTHGVTFSRHDPIHELLRDRPEHEKRLTYKNIHPKRWMEENLAILSFYVILLALGLVVGVIGWVGWKKYIHPYFVSRQIENTRKLAAEHYEKQREARQVHLEVLPSTSVTTPQQGVVPPPNEEVGTVSAPMEITPEASSETPTSPQIMRAVKCKEISQSDMLGSNAGTDEESGLKEIMRWFSDNPSSFMKKSEDGEEIGGAAMYRLINAVYQPLESLANPELRREHIRKKGVIHKAIQELPKADWFQRWIKRQVNRRLKPNELYPQKETVEPNQFRVVPKDDNKQNIA